MATQVQALRVGQGLALPRRSAPVRVVLRASKAVGTSSAFVGPRQLVAVTVGRSAATQRRLRAVVSNWVQQGHVAAFRAKPPPPLRCRIASQVSAAAAQTCVPQRADFRQQRSCVALLLPHSSWHRPQACHPPWQASCGRKRKVVARSPPQPPAAPLPPEHCPLHTPPWLQLHVQATDVEPSFTSLLDDEEFYGEAGEEGEEMTDVEVDETLLVRCPCPCMHWVCVRSP